MRLTTSLLAFTILSALAGRANATGEIDIFESGANVVAAGAGVFDITDLTFSAGSSGSAVIAPSRGGVAIGSPADSAFYASLSGPSSFCWFYRRTRSPYSFRLRFRSGASGLRHVRRSDDRFARTRSRNLCLHLGQWRSRRQLDHQDRGDRNGSGTVHLGDDGSRIRRSRAHRLSRVA
jgi:hypothetical protein